MSHIRSKNTKPEVRLRKELFRLGYRYRINKKGLIGSPDIVLAKYRTCIFVNGCFWHGQKDYLYLESLGWRVIVVWECELKKDRIDDTIASVRKQLDANRESWLAEQADRRKRREEWQAEIKRRKERTSELLCK